jgi:hypothetical protein
MNASIDSMENAIAYYSTIIAKQADGVDGNTAIMAGHQVLGPNGTPVNLGIFPEATAEAARSIQKITKETSTVRTKVFTLIDDKRWLDDNHIREAFWDNQNKTSTPLSIGTGESMLDSFALGERRIHSNLQGLWSEKALMTKFTSRLKRQTGLKELINNDMKEILHWEQGNGIEREVCMNDGCNINGCSREVIEMLIELSQRGIKRLIMFVPNSCEIGINHACEIACNNPEVFFNNQKIVVHNCFLNSGLSKSGKTPPKTTEEVFKNCTVSFHK